MTAIGTLPVLFATGIHSARPAASAVGAGGLYSCTTHSLVYQTDGSSWTTWATLGSTVTRASLGLDTTDSPQFAAINVGNASDTTVDRLSAGDIEVEGNRIFRVGGADVPVADGGTGASTASGARTNLGVVPGTDVASLTAGVVPIAQLATGTPNGTKFVRDDGTLAVPPGSGGSDLVQTNSGAGSVYIPGLRGDPNVKPASPSSFDDEFEALSGWTTLGTLDTSTVSDVPSHWHAKRVEAGVALDGIYKTAPSMPFTVTAKLSDSNLFISANYNHIGILLTETSPGKLCSVGLVTNGGVQYVSTYRWTNRTTLATNVDTSTSRDAHYPIWKYIQVLVTSSTSISVSISENGHYWWPVTSQQAITTGLTVANVGLCIGDAAAGGTVEAYFDWIRFT